MEGWNPSVGCALNCKSCYRGWVPNPLNSFTRRDPLIDAVRRTFSPCDRPARSPPFCQPVPALKGPRELPLCSIADYSQEKAEAKERENGECVEKYREWENSTKPFVQVSSGSNRICLSSPNCGDEGRYMLVDKPIRTDILIGTFNPNDNKTREQLLREKCDRFWKPCGPAGLRPYPCRGVIDFPPQEMVDLSVSNYNPEAEDCRGTKYVDPQYMEQQYKEQVEHMGKTHNPQQ